MFVQFRVCSWIVFVRAEKTTYQIKHFSFFQGDLVFDSLVNPVFDPAPVPHVNSPWNFAEKPDDSEDQSRVFV